MDDSIGISPDVATALDSGPTLKNYAVVTSVLILFSIGLFWTIWQYGKLEANAEAVLAPIFALVGLIGLDLRREPISARRHLYDLELCACEVRLFHGRIDNTHRDIHSPGSGRPLIEVALNRSQSPISLNVPPSKAVRVV